MKNAWLMILGFIVGIVAILYFNGVISLGPKLTTPYQDAMELVKRLERCKSLKEIDEVEEDAYEIMSLYEQEVYEGKRPMSDLNTFIDVFRLRGKKPGE